MKRSLFTFVIFQFLHLSLFAEVPIIDSLKQLLLVHKEDTNRVNVLNDLAWELRWEDLDSAHKYARQAKSLSEMLSFERGLITSFCRLGTILIDKEEFSSAESIYLKVLGSEKRLGYVYGIGRAQNQLGEIYRNKEEYQKAKKYTLAAIKSFESIQNENSVAMSCNKLGSIYEEMGQFGLALKYLLRGLEIRQRIGNLIGAAHCHLNIGAFYISIKSYPEAFKSLLKAKEIFSSYEDESQLAKVYLNIGLVHFGQYKFDTSLQYYKKSLAINNKLNSHFSDPVIFNNIGAVYYKKGDIDNALSFYLKSCQIQESKEQGVTLIDSYKNVGDIFMEKDDFEKAIKHYRVALSKTVRSGKKTTEIQLLKNLSNCYTFTGEYEMADKFGKRSISLADSLEENFRDAISLHNIYTEEVNKGKLLEKDSKIKDSKLENVNSKNNFQLLVIISLIVGLLLLLILFFSVLRNKKQKQRTLFKQQQIEELLKNQELKSLNAMIEGQEEERQRIAKDLHDRLGSMLSVVKMHYKSVEDQIDSLQNSFSGQYEKANNLLDEACQEVRNIAHDMISGTLDKFGLIAAIEDLTETINDSNKIHVEFIAHGIEERFSQSTEVTLYRIIQEIVSNTLKYANASELSIQIVKSRDNLNLIIEDNGGGFNTEKTYTGMGLKNIASRIDNLNGTLNIDSGLGKGTSISFDIPYNKEK